MSKRLFILLTSFVLVLSLVCNAGAQGTGTIMYELWMDIGGTEMEDLTGNANFPDNPTSAEELTLFETPTDIADNFGGRLYGWLHPVTSGDYTFWIATDDDGDLLLSTDDDPANAVIICGVDGWAPARAFDGEAGAPGTRQMSAPIPLVGGQKYYIEGRYKEGGGGDNLAVAWQGPDSPERTVIDGSFLSPAPFNVNLLKAKDPNPADGAVDADTSSLEWAPGPTSVSYKVYLSTDETIEESELVAETNLTIHLVVLDIGAAYWWRVDAIEADGTVREGNVWSFTTLPLEAHFPSPADGAKAQPLDSQLSWTGGKGVIMHDLYFGTDEALVAAGDPSTFKGKVMVTSYDPGPLDLETTYYWKVDEFSVTGTIPGPVWSFTSFGAIEITDPDLLLYYDFESGEGTVAIDQSGHSNHGYFMGTPEWDTGIYGGGLAIDIADLDYVQTAGSLGITSNNITVAGWVKHDESPAAWSGILTTRGSGNLGLQHNGVELRYMWGADEYWWVETGLEIPNGEWYFAALTIAPDQGKLYLNGIEQTLTNVAEHVPVTFDSQIRVARDHQDGRIMTCLIDEVRLYNKTLTDVEILGIMGTFFDVTGPGDIVQGVPNDGDWPGAETPDLAVDDDVTTKYLHFKGDFDPDPGTGGAGLQITPASGANVVTGLTFTTANDVPGRDPIAFELSGSNDSIDGPYTLIASGDIVDFAQEAEWPRFTQNATAISFFNNVAYEHYQLIFTAIRGPVGGSVNSMQIAEVELLSDGVLPVAENVVLKVDFNSNQDNGGDSTTADDPSLSAAAHNQPGWSSYHANHEVAAEFSTANYDGITVTPAWPNTTDNRVQQSIDRGTGNDDNWDNAAGDIDLVTDFIGIDTRVGNGGNGDWDGTTGTPTYMTLAIGGLSAGDYDWTSFHHDTEHVFGPFAVWLSTDGGATFTQLDDGIMTDSTEGGSPDSGATEVGPDVNSLSSVYHASFSADGVNDVVFRFAPYSSTDVHRQIWGMNGFVLSAVPVDNLLANGGFEDGVANSWNTYGDATLEVVQESPVEGSYCLHVTVGSAGANFWDAGLQHGGHVFEAGKSYVLSIWFKSLSGPFQINMKPERAASPWEGYGEQGITITEEWVEYTVNTGVIPETVDPASITFHIAYAPGEFLADDAKFYEVE